MFRHAPQTPELAGVTHVIEAITACRRVLDAAGVWCGHGTDNTWDEAVQLVLYAAGLPADAPATAAEHPLDDAGVRRLDGLLRQRIDERVPLPYLTGEAWFAGLQFACDRRALVPRSPLAELIMENYRPWYTGIGPGSVLDLCCGGGAIGIAAAVHAPSARVVLSDIDAEALALGASNIARHGVGERVRLLQGDLFGGLHGQRFDVILCNPPYVDAGDLAGMPPEYQYEPPIGLGAGEDGLDLARRVLAQAETHLSAEGILLLEVGNSWQALEEAYPRVAFTWIELAAGGHGVLCMQASELREYADALAYTAQNPS